MGVYGLLLFVRGESSEGIGLFSFFFLHSGCATPRLTRQMDEAPRQDGVGVCFWPNIFPRVIRLKKMYNDTVVAFDSHSF